MVAHGGPGVPSVGDQLGQAFRRPGEIQPAGQRGRRSGTANTITTAAWRRFPGRRRGSGTSARRDQRERHPETDAATGLGRCPGDGIGRRRRWLHRRHVRGNPGSGDHHRRHLRRSTPRQPGPAAGRRHHRRPWPRRTGRDAVGNRGPAAAARVDTGAFQRGGTRLLARLDHGCASRSARLRRLIRQTPDDGWHRYPRGASHRKHEKGRTAYPSRKPSSLTLTRLAGGDRSAGHSPGDVFGCVWRTPVR